MTNKRMVQVLNKLIRQLDAFRRMHTRLSVTATIRLFEITATAKKALEELKNEEDRKD